eukprot:365824-Chlamydomonas_euryale.AAC.6
MHTHIHIHTHTCAHRCAASINSGRPVKCPRSPNSSSSVPAHAVQVTWSRASPGSTPCARSVCGGGGRGTYAVQVNWSHASSGSTPPSAGSVCGEGGAGAGACMWCRWSCRAQCQGRGPVQRVRACVLGGGAHLEHQPGHMGLAKQADACSNKRGAMGYGSRRQQMVVVEESEFGESRAGAILMFGQVGVKIAAKTICSGRQAAGDRRRSRLSAPRIKRA